MSRFYSLVVVLSLLAGCKNDNHEHEDRKDGFSETAKTPEDSLYQLVMDGHDAGMGKLGKIKAYLGQAKAGLDSVGKLKASPEKEKLQQAYMDIQEDLNYAEYGMNTWMEEFNPDSATGNPAARFQYLAGEKEKVDKVKESILVALQKADSLFKK